MLRIKTTIKPSGIHGIGLFADQFIPEGTVTWSYDPEIDPSYTPETIAGLPEPMQSFMNFYCYFDTARGKYVLPADHLRFINHTEDATRVNIQSTPDQDIALRDIQPGEELLCDYFKFDPDYFARHGLARDQLS